MIFQKLKQQHAVFLFVTNWKLRSPSFHYPIKSRKFLHSNPLKEKRFDKRPFSIVKIMSFKNGQTTLCSFVVKTKDSFLFYLSLLDISFSYPKDKLLTCLPFITRILRFTGISHWLIAKFSWGQCYKTIVVIFHDKLPAVRKPYYF